MNTQEIRSVITALLNRDQKNTCQHQETHRGDVLWEICDRCGVNWADDEGGRPEWQEPTEWIAAQKLLDQLKTQSLREYLDCGVCEGEPDRCDPHDCGDCHYAIKNGIPDHIQDQGPPKDEEPVAWVTDCVTREVSPGVWKWRHGEFSTNQKLESGTPLYLQPKRQNSK